MCDCANSTNKITIDVHAYNTIYEKAVCLDLLYNFIKSSQWITKEDVCTVMNWEELIEKEDAVKAESEEK